MKNKFKYISIIVGVVLIIFGALIPTMFKVEKDKLAFHRDMGASEYSCQITITSKKDYEVNSAIVYFEDFFGKQEITKEVSSGITKTKIGDDFVYTFVVQMTSFGEYSEFSKVKEVKLSTSIGTRIATESAFKWTTPVMIIMIIAGVVFVIVGVSMISKEKIQNNLAQKARKDLAQSNPEINTSNMSDAEVLAKQRELRFSKMQEEGNPMASLFGIEQKPKEKICEYCGATNSAEANKCSSCGANLKTKK